MSNSMLTLACITEVTELSPRFVRVELGADPFRRANGAGLHPDQLEPGRGGNCYSSMISMRTGDRGLPMHAKM